MKAESFCFVEHTDFAIRVVGYTAQGKVPRIEYLKEVPTIDATAASSLLRNTGLVAAVRGAAVRPALQLLRLAGEDEAKRCAGPGGIPALLGADKRFDGEPIAWAATEARTGAAPGTTSWIAVGTTLIAHQGTCDLLASFNLGSPRCLSGALATAGAVAATCGARTVVVELGQEQSHALLIDSGGVRGVVPVGMNRDAIAAAVQAELGLKFRGAAGKLFFNPEYDFSEVGAKVAARLVETLKPQLEPWLRADRSTTHLFCPNLPLPQQWLAAQLASALELTLHAPDVKKWCSQNGVELAESVAGSEIAPIWIGALRSVQALARAGDSAPAWLTEWRLPSPKGPPATGENASPKTAGTAAAAVPSRIPTEAIQRVAEPPAVAATGGAAVSPKAVRTNGSVATAAMTSASLATDVVPAKPQISAFAEPASQQAQSKPSTSSVSYPPKPAPVEKRPSGDPRKAMPAPAASRDRVTDTASKVSGPPTTKSEVGAATPRGRGRFPLIAAAIAVVVVGLVLFFVQSQRREAARLAAEKTAAEQRLQAEQERARIAEQKIREEAEARQKIELDLSGKLSLAETARKQAEEEARNQAAARLANARGTVEIVTEPAGATVTLGNLPPRPSPATFSEIRIGRYPVSIQLRHHDDVQFEVEVKENAVVAVPVVALTRAVGRLEILSEPAGLSYEARPARALMVDPSLRRTGQTPAMLDDLPPDDYVITMSREGWTPYSETVTVTRGGTAQVSWRVPTGLIQVSSVPAGAVVRRANVEIGVAPLVMAEQPPGVIELELTSADYLEPVRVSGEVRGGSTLELAAQFSPKDRIHGPDELDERPEPAQKPRLKVPYYLTLEKPRLELELVVDRDGNPHRIRAVQTTSADLAKVGLAAVSKWKFTPPRKAGAAVHARTTLVISNFTADAD